MYIVEKCLWQVEVLIKRVSNIIVLVIILIEFLGFLFIAVLGTILHFTYDLSNHNKYVALFSAVNESVWEHMKLVVFPSLIWLLFEIPFLYQNSNFITAKAAAIVIMLLFIPLVFYFYKYVFKNNSFIVDILIFYAAIGLGQYFSYLVLKLQPVSLVWNYISLFVLIFIYGYFLIATFLPGDEYIYVDPITKKVGVAGHRLK